MSLDIEDLGSFVFEEMACNYLGYSSLLAETVVLDHYQKDINSGNVVLLVNEIGKLPHRVEFEIKIKESRRLTISDELK